MKKQLRRIAALCTAVLTLWTATAATQSHTVSTALQAMGQSGQAAVRILRWELGNRFGTDLLTAANVLALQQSPLLISRRSTIVSLMSQALEVPETDSSAPDTPQPQPQPQESTYPEVTVSSEGLSFADNGVPSQTVIPTTTKGYTVVNGVHIKNSSSRTLKAEELSKTAFSARLGSEGPQVLILHSHATEAYSMPEGQEYKASGTFRTKDTTCNVVRVGDEIAAVLSTYGISVLHDRTLHDAASYNAAYDSSYDSIEQYLEKYPTISFVLDVHRDAIQDSSGKQYKLVTKEDPNVAQCSLVMGVAHDGWKDNLQLAVAVQERLNALSPTLMRPVVTRGYRYNQQLCPGSLLVEIGAAGNSLDEALMGARYFATGFAETILAAG